MAQTATITTNGATTADDAALVDDGVNKKKTYRTKRVDKNRL